MWYVYIIESDDGSLYTGITTDVKRRFAEHQMGKRGARYFAGRVPLAVLYIEQCADRSEASKREYQIKRLTAKNKRGLIAEFDASILARFF